MSEKHPVVLPEKELENNMQAYRDSLMLTASLLAESQKEPVGNRDFGFEVSIAWLSLSTKAKLAEKTDFELGASEIEAEGIVAEYIPREWVRDSRNPDEIRKTKHFSGGLDHVQDHRIVGSFPIHGFARGDKLGHGGENELKDEWYLVMGWKKLRYVPVKGLSNIKLRVFDSTSLASISVSDRYPVFLE